MMRIFEAQYDVKPNPTAYDKFQEHITTVAAKPQNYQIAFTDGQHLPVTGFMTEVDGWLRFTAADTDHKEILLVRTSQVSYIRVTS